MSTHSQTVPWWISLFRSFIKTLHRQRAEIQVCLSFTTLHYNVLSPSFSSTTWALRCLLHQEVWVQCNYYVIRFTTGRHATTGRHRSVPFFTRKPHIYLSSAPQAVTPELKVLWTIQFSYFISNKYVPSSSILTCKIYVYFYILMTSKWQQLIMHFRLLKFNSDIKSELQQFASKKEKGLLPKS